METIELLQLLDNVLDGFDNKSNLKYHLLKEQIENKILIIKNFMYYGFPVLNYTHQEQLDILYCLRFAGKIADIDNMINNILNNIYESSGYQLLLTNIPTKAETQTIGDEDIVDTVDTIYTIEPINSERVYDTLEFYSGKDNIESVLQISDDTYVAKFQLDSDAIKIAKIIDNNMISNNIIGAKYIVQIANFKDSMYMDDSMICVESDCDKYENEFKNEFKNIEPFNLLTKTEPYKIDEYEYEYEYNYIEPLTPSKSIENIESLEKPVEYNINDIDDIDDTSDINANNEVRGAKAIDTEASTWQVYERKSLLGVLFNNIVGSISNKIYAISRYFQK